MYPIPDVLIRTCLTTPSPPSTPTRSAWACPETRYLRRQLATEAGPHATVTLADLKRSSRIFADLNDPNVMSGMELRVQAKWGRSHRPAA